MKRRNFLALIGVGLGLAAAPALANASNKLRHPLVPVADRDTSLEPAKYEKSVKLARYVITKEKFRPQIVSFNANYSIGPDARGSQNVEAVIVLDGLRYTIVVGNSNEKIDNRPDGIDIHIRPDGTHGQSYIAFLKDKGLDGRVNHAYIGEKFTQFNNTGKYLKFDERVKTVHERPYFSLNPKNLGFFQDLYDRTLDTLIAFYERPTK